MRSGQRAWLKMNEREPRPGIRVFPFFHQMGIDKDLKVNILLFISD